MAVAYGPVAYSDDSSGWEGYNARQVIPASALSYSGNSIRVKMAYYNADWFFESCYIGHQGAGDEYDFDGNQVQLLFDAVASATVSEGGITSDAVAFDLDSTKNLVISFYFSDEDYDVIPVKEGQTGYALPYKSGSDETATTDVTGYDAWDDVQGLVESIEASVKSALSIINSLYVGSTVDIVNSLNAQLTSTVDLHHSILQKFESSFGIKLTIGELVKFNDTLDLLNRIFDTDSGITHGEYYFLRSHGL